VEEVMDMRKTILRSFMILPALLGVFGIAYGVADYAALFNTTYGAVGGFNDDPALGGCLTCHPVESARNAYAIAWTNSGRDFAAIECLDSDGDGFTNIAEIKAGTFPGDPGSRPELGLVGKPVPVIAANGQTGIVTVSTNQAVRITITLDAGDMAGHESDWWIIASSPFGVFSYAFSTGWQPGLVPASQAPLFNLSAPFSVLDFKLPMGAYSFFMAVDDNADGVPDATYLDLVTVMVQ
jgi:hypothetical protein